MPCILIGLLIIGFVSAVDFLMAFPFMWLWNWLIPSIFHLTAITYWQAFGLVLFLSLFTAVGIKSK